MFASSSSFSYHTCLTLVVRVAHGNEESKIDALFHCYDRSGQNQISFSQLLKMFYSYPKQELLQIISEDPSTALCQSDTHKNNLQNTFSNNELDASVVDDLELSRRSRFPTHDDSKSLHYCSASNRKLKSKFASKITVSIKKYAQHLFRQAGLKSIHDKLNYSQFRDIVHRHNKLYTSYIQGFHVDLWYCDPVTKHPSFKDLRPQVESYLLYSEDGQFQTRRYLKLIKHALLVFKDSDSFLPLQIKCLEGLQVEFRGRSFVLQHRHDNNYRSVTFRHNENNQGVWEAWKKHLTPYTVTSFHEKYQILDRVGVGAYSVVCKCINRKNSKQYAIKIVNKDELGDQNLQVIKDQVRIISQCHHPNIIKLKETAETNSHVLIVTEFLPDGDLFDYLQQKDYLQEAEAAGITQQILQTVKYLNEQGLVHRDLKPENIMICKHPTDKTVEKVKLIDFGYAIYIDTLKNLEMKYKYVGTLNYTAPEIMYGHDSYDEKVDIFSVGVIMYFLLSGQLPFDSPTKEEVQAKTLEGQYDLSRGRWGFVSESAKDLIRKMLEPDHQKRISTKEALGHDWIKHKQPIMTRLLSF